MKKENCKKMLAKINRGLVLGLVLVIALAAFITVDTAAFNKSKPRLRDMVVGYLGDMLALNDLIETSDIGCAISETDAASIKAGFHEVISKYYGDPAEAGKITVYKSHTPDEIEAQLDKWLRMTAAFELDEAKLLPEDEKASILFIREGQKYARVQIECLPLELTVTASTMEARNKSVDLFIGAGPNYHMDMIFEAPTEYLKTFSVRRIITGSLYLFNDDGEWKILMSEFLVYDDPDAEDDSLMGVVHK